MPLSRRAFVSGTALLGAAACTTSSDALPVDSVEPSSWWQGPPRARWFRHEAVDAARVEQGLVRARIEGRWQQLETVFLPEVFVQWSMRLRLERLRDIRRGLFDPRELDGPHNGCVATWGGPGRDHPLSLNTAFKGLGFLPAAEVLPALVDRVQAVPRGDLEAATALLAELYSNPVLFDLRKKVSLELYTTPEYMTHTFLNMMVNPVASASFLAMPTYELRAVPQLLHPLDPGLSEHERLVVRYTNAIHDLVHSGGETRISCVYHLVGVYDDTPNARGHGTRLA